MLTTTVCAALSAAGLAVAFLTAYRRRFVAATRIAAIALLPVGLAMAGLIELGGTVVKAMGEWAADLVLKPTVWAGFGVLAVAVVLYVVARVAGARSGGAEAGGGQRRPGRRERRAAARAREEGAVAPGAAAPSLGAGESAPAKKERAKGTAKGTQGTSGGGEDFSDIEAILKKHGI